MSNRKEIFSQTYKYNRFKGVESKSGKGSDPENTQTIITQLANIIEKYDIKIFLDAPCGDCYWIKNVIPNTKIEKYIGVDIVPQLIEDNIKNYACETITFQELDLVENVPPKADLLLCRDCLVHLSFDSAKKLLKNLIASETPYLLLTTFARQRKNMDFEDGTNWYPIDLLDVPFNFPKPIELINEDCKECDGSFNDKSLGLWRREDLIQYVETL